MPADDLVECPRCFKWVATIHHICYAADPKKRTPKPVSPPADDRSAPMPLKPEIVNALNNGDWLNFTGEHDIIIELCASHERLRDAWAAERGRADRAEHEWAAVNNAASAEFERRERVERDLLRAALTGFVDSYETWSLHDCPEDEICHCCLEATRFFQLCVETARAALDRFGAEGK